jgi:cyclic-di-GMP-binding biofilm dispersal mediator protein
VSPRSLDGASILVAGATGGLGSRVAHVLAARGARLTLTARHGAALSALRLDGAATIALDLLERDAPVRAVAAALDAHGRLDGVLCCAGAVAFGPLDETPADVLEAVLDLGLLVPLRLAQSAIPVLEPGGFVANVSGVVAEVPTANLVAYSAAKAGASAAYRALGRELRRRGLSAIDLRPPHTETGLATRALAGAPPRLPAGLDPDAVAERIVAAIEADEREVPGTAFA